MKFRLPNDITVTELLAQHDQDADLTQKLWEPLCIAALNTPIHKASAQVLLNVLRDALNQSRDYSDMLLPRIDFTALFPQRAADYVEQHGGKVHIACGVEALHPLEDGIEISHRAGQRKIQPRHLRRAAGGRRQTAAPDSPTLAETVAQIDSLEHQPIYTVYLQYPAHVTLPHPMLGLHQRYSQWLFDKGRIAGQHGLLAAVISAEGIHQELSQDELAQKVIAELREEFGIAGATAVVQGHRRKARHVLLRTQPATPVTTDTPAPLAAGGRLHGGRLSGHAGRRGDERVEMRGCACDAAR